MRALKIVLPLVLVLGACDEEMWSSRDGGWTGGKQDKNNSPGDAPLFPDQPRIEPPPPKQDSACGGQDIPIILKKKGEVPDLFMVVDISGSMMMPIDLFNLAKGTKWQIMRKVLTNLVDSYKTNIRFGLSLYPSDNSCGAGKIDVPLQTGNHPAVKSKLTSNSPRGNTPIYTTLAKVNTYLKSVPLTKGARYVMLATDGMPNCGAASDTDTSKETLAEVVKLATGATKVFIVGFGGIVNGNSSFLNQLAAAGKAPNPKGPNKFYSAANEKQLKDALFAIAGGIIPPNCTYTLTSKPQDLEKVTVKFDGVAVPRNLSNKDGWNYTSNNTEITFYGSYCTKLKQGQVKKVQFLFGCKGPVIK